MAGRLGSPALKRGVLRRKWITVVAMRLSHVRGVGIYNGPALFWWNFEMLLQPGDHLVQPTPILEVGKDKWSFGTHPPCIALHHFERSSHVRCQVYFVDQQQVRACDARTTFTRDFVAA